MILFNTYELFAAITLIIILVIISVYFQYIRKNTKVALFLLLFIGFFLRLFMASLDPFLQDWDERFHALVAKNLMNYPLKPMLRVNPIMPYKIEDWCCNHIWVHKQPLFLWQMALSMKLFGVNEIAMRLPSVIMGTISIFFIYDIAKKWVKNLDVAYLAALLFTVSYYQIELTSGRFALDQNDVAFSFYVTASIWAFIRYLNSNNNFKWAVIIGLFVGAAVLNKWLTGILIFGGWGLFELLSFKGKINFNQWKPLIISITTSILVFLPWQLYIIKNFPVESSIMYEHNRRHIFEVVENHHGSIFFHFNQMSRAYGELFLIFIPIGLFFIFTKKRESQKLTISLLAMVVVIFSFFSFIVKTKMSAFTYPVNSIIWIFIASGLVFSYKFFIKKTYTIMLFVTLISVFTLKPWEIIVNRLSDNVNRNAKISNTKIYKSLDINDKLKDRVIINCKPFEETELMFYQNVNAYHWYPDEKTLDSLLNRGYKFAAFKNHNNQNLPEYIRNKKEIIIIDEEIK